MDVGENLLSFYDLHISISSILWNPFLVRKRKSYGGNGGSEQIQTKDFGVSKRILKVTNDTYFFEGNVHIQIIVDFHKRILY